MTDDKIVALATLTSIAQNWNVGTGSAAIDLGPAELDHYLSVVANRETPTAHRITMGNGLVPLLVKLGDWQRLHLLVFNDAVPQDVSLFAANGMGAIMQMLFASGKEVPGELQLHAHAFVNGTRLDDKTLTEFGTKLALVYADKELIEPLFALANQNRNIRFNNASRSFALECILKIISKRLDEKREVTDDTYRIFINYLAERKDLVLPAAEVAERKLIGKKFVELCHKHNLRSVLVRVSQRSGIPREVKEQAEVLALRLVTEKIGVEQARGGITVTVDGPSTIRPPSNPQPARPTAKPPPIPLDARVSQLKLPPKR